jgi:hypothetical protein
MRTHGKLLIPLLLLAAAAVAQDLPNLSPFVLQRFAVATPPPDFSTRPFDARMFHVEHSNPPVRWATPPVAPQARPMRIPMLRTLQQNRLIASLAGGIPAIARAFDEDAVARHRVDVGPLIDIDDGRIGIRMRIRLSQ